MKYINGVVATLALVSAGAVHAQTIESPSDSETERITMTEAVERALNNSPELVRANGTVATTDWAERTALGSYLPSLSLNSGASRSSSSRFDERTQTTIEGANESYSAGLSLSYPLFTGGRRGAEMKRAEANSSSADAVLVETRFGVILQTKTAFFNVQRQEELAQVAEGNVKRAEEALEAAQRRQDVGSATRSDVLRAQLELNNARQALLSAQTQQRTASFALGALTGASGPVGVRVDSLAVPRPLPVADAELIRSAVAQAPALASADAAVTAARAGTAVARAQYLPSISVGSGYDWSNREPTFSNGNTGWSLRLSMSYPIFNGFSRESQVANADVQLRNATSSRTAAERQVRADVERVLGQLRLAEQQIKLASEAVTVAREDLRVNQERYRLGMATILDLLLSQTSLRSAESDLVGTRYDYEIARAELEALIGRQL
jgi:TolC family type I secretion outer membrane protein